jgi:hypothetical protein
MLTREHFCAGGRVAAACREEGVERDAFEKSGVGAGLAVGGVDE